MKILFLTCRYPTKPDHFTLEKELVSAFNKNGHDCTVANILEKKHNKNTYLETLEDNVKVLHIKTGNLFNDVSFLEKKITVLSFPYIIPKIIKHYLGTKQFDLIIAYGPFLCASGTIKPLKEHFNCKSLLMQWDIFPQNAYDLGIIKNKLIYKYLKYKQKTKLKLYDLILCNSTGNIKYFERHFNQETKNKLHLFHNCESKVINHKEQAISNHKALKEKARKELNLPANTTILIFGGNIGIPQQLENIINFAKLSENTPSLQFIIIGQGTEANKIKQLSNNFNNITFYDFLPSKEYEKLLQAADYGIVSLSEKFTVPNFPAKISSYLKSNLPILACLDDAAYDDVGEFIESNVIGYRLRSSVLSKFNNHQEFDAINKELIEIKQLQENLLDQNSYSNIQANTNEVFDKIFNINNTFKSLIKVINA